MNSETVKQSSLNEKADVTKVNMVMPKNPLDLKLKINTLLWEELPAQTKLHDAEEIACRIFMMIAEGDVRPQAARLNMAD